MAIVYKITNVANGISYIGATKTSLKKRFGSHVCDANRGKRSEFYKAMREYGYRNFNVVALEKCSEDEMFIREEFLINKHKTMWPLGYNTSSSHLKGSTQSDIVKQKKSKAQFKRWKRSDRYEWSEKMKEVFSSPEVKEAHRQGIKNSWTEERREEYAEKAKNNVGLIAAKGYLRSGEVCSKSVVLFDIESKIETEYSSVSECARQNGWSVAAVSKQIKNQGFLFEKYIVKFESNKTKIIDLLEIALNKDLEKREKMSLAKKGKSPWNKGRRVPI